MTTSESWKTLEGGCPCGNIRYRLEQKPLFTHCCHCTWCQRETGTAFALNNMIETKFVTVTSSEQPVMRYTPSLSGLGQKMYRCPSCQFALWSVYGDSGDFVRFVRGGTLDEPARCPPSIHIFTTTKQPWLILGDSVPIVEEFYDREKYWPKESLSRLEELKKSLM